MNRYLSLAIVLAACTANAEDWRQFRGPRGSSVSQETNVPSSLHPERHVAWKTTLPGRGLSSPIIVGDRIFITACSGARQERLHVLCFNAADGSKRWERQFWATGRTTCHEKISVATPTPVSDGTRIFALFSSNDLVCLDLDGQLLWLRGLMRDYPNASNNLGLSSSPVCEDGVLVVQAESTGGAFAAGVDTGSGTNRWRIDRPTRANWTSPMVTRAANGQSIVLLQSSSGLDAIDLLHGTKIWSYSSGLDAVASSAWRGSTLFVPAKGITALDLTSATNPPVTLWRSPLLRPSTASPVILGEKVFTLNDAGVLTCGETSAGKRLWQLRMKGPFSATPVGVGRYLYVVNETGIVQVVDAEAPEGQIVSELNLGETILSTPSVSSGAIYFRSDATLWKIAES